MQTDNHKYQDALTVLSKAFTDFAQYQKHCIVSYHSVSYFVEIALRYYKLDYLYTVDDIKEYYDEMWVDARL
jgi:hypothetical protein